MTRNYWTDGSSALQPQYDDDDRKIVPFPNGDREDYSAPKDFSRPKDYSSYGDKVVPFPGSQNPRNESNNSTKSSPANAERNGTGGGGSSSRDIALFLASAESHYINGTVVTADGGWMNA